VKLSFRLMILTTLMILIGASVLLIAVINYLDARKISHDLASEILNQTGDRVAQELGKVVQQAPKLSGAVKQQMKDGRLKTDDFPGLVAYLHQTMQITDTLTGYFVGAESTGEATGITRITGKPRVWQSNRSDRSPGYEVREYWLNDYPRQTISLDSPSTGPDIRTRPWYQAAKLAGRPIWTESFVFLGVEGNRNMHGVTFATPLYQNDGSLLGVLGADFELLELCTFLKTVSDSHNDMAFVMEEDRKGGRRVIAHPDAELLLRVSTKQDHLEKELMPPEDFPDPRVSAFANAAQALAPTEKLSQNGTLRFRVGDSTYLGIIHHLDADLAPPWIICTLLPEKEVLGNVHHSIRITLLTGVIILAMAWIVSFFVSRQVARPLERIAQEAMAVGKLSFQSHPIAHSFVNEVDRLAVAMEEMKGGLRSFQKFVPPELVAAFVQSDREARVGGERRRVTMFFSDITDFTTIAEKLSPEDLVKWLCEYLNVLSKEIEAAAGTVDKYIGDAIMAFWGAPALNPHHAVAACTTALRCQKVIRRLAPLWKREGKSPFVTRMGLHTGEVVVGNIGSDARLNYTVIGDAVNLASRIEGLNKLYGTSILISESTYLEVRETIVARPLDYVSVKGRQLPLLIYEPLGEESDGNPTHHKLADLATRAIQHYRERKWHAAIALLEEVLLLRADDPPTLLLLDRCRDYEKNPPGPEWDGVHRVLSK
jgi:adenylate cyclase